MHVFNAYCRARPGCVDEAIFAEEIPRGSRVAARCCRTPGRLLRVATGSRACPSGFAPEHCAAARCRKLPYRHARPSRCSRSHFRANLHPFDMPPPRWPAPERPSLGCGQGAATGGRGAAGDNQNGQKQIVATHDASYLRPWGPRCKEGQGFEACPEAEPGSRLRRYIVLRS